MTPLTDFLTSLFHRLYMMGLTVRMNTVSCREKILLRVGAWVAVGMTYIVPNIPQCRVTTMRWEQ